MVSIHFRSPSLRPQFKTYILKLRCCPCSYPCTWSARHSYTDQIKYHLKSHRNSTPEHIPTHTSEAETLQSPTTQNSNQIPDTWTTKNSNLICTYGFSYPMQKVFQNTLIYTAMLKYTAELLGVYLKLLVYIQNGSRVLIKNEKEELVHCSYNVVIFAYSNQAIYSNEV